MILHDTAGWGCPAQSCPSSLVVAPVASRSPWAGDSSPSNTLEPLPTQGIFHPSNFMMYCKELFILRHGKLWSCLGSRAVSALHLTKGWSNPTVQVFLTLCWTLKRRGSMTEVFVQAFLTPLLRNKRFEKTHQKRTLLLKHVWDFGVTVSRKRNTHCQKHTEIKTPARFPVHR